MLTGVTSPAEAVLAPPSQRPTYLAEDLTGLLEPHPAVTSQDGAFGCGGWTARRDGDRLELTGAGERIDGLRALCAAAWAATEGSPTRESVAVRHPASVPDTLNFSASWLPGVTPRVCYRPCQAAQSANTVTTLVPPR